LSYLLLFNCADTAHNKFLAGIARVAETLAAEITVETCFVTSPV